MKKKINLLSVLVFVLGIVGTSNAALWDRGGGLIYDEVLDITWLQDATYAGITMTWDDAVAWADGLEYYDSERDTTWTDWRLASMDVNGDETIVNCNGASESECRDNEYGYMYYQNLGGINGDYLAGDLTVGDVTIHLPAASGFITHSFWSGQEYTNPDQAWYFRFIDGGQGVTWKANLVWPWAVRDGNVPIPSTVWFLGSGLIGLVGIRRVFKKGYNP